MAEKQIVDFMARLHKKQKKKALKEKISASGWVIEDNGVRALDSEICVYIIDTTSEGVMLFACNKADIPAPHSDKVIHWGQFVLAWDVIADPAMAFDETHKFNTIDFAMRALPSLDQWPEFLNKACNTAENMTAHILVIVDRQNLDAPLELIVAHATSQVLNAESIQSIVDNYIKGM